jgi:hypothetical protein
MRRVTEYLGKAAEFEALAAEARDAAQRTRYADLGACYRLLAEERQRLISEGAIADEWSGHAA